MRSLTDFTDEQLVRHVAHLVDSVGRQGATDLADELAYAAKLLQYRYDTPAGQGVKDTRPDGGIPAVDLMRQVTWEGNGFLAVTTGEIRRTFGAGPIPLAEQLAGHYLLTLPPELPAEDDAKVLLYSNHSQMCPLIEATVEDSAAVIDDLVDHLRRSRADRH